MSDIQKQAIFIILWGQKLTGQLLQKILFALSSLEVRTSGLWSVEFEQSCPSYGAWLCKYLGRSRVSGWIGAVWPLYFPLMRELFTAITREATDALTSPRATSILSVPTTGNNANLGRNSWKDRPLELSLNGMQIHDATTQ
ncbi:hypothetical protein AVEN_47021-1 [Araneus ventricosus]|uniref:Uncharacterized protein n=1 Tax=Araneus ventricosus TaxID=182803 RepID=A0A4Y2MSE1_ARAVE|nr:hypothetical protein AVEN_47021-1 [Araneus ventricosus]